MKTKRFTTIEDYEKLRNILPEGSSDMWWNVIQPLKPDDDEPFKLVPDGEAWCYLDLCKREQVAIAHIEYVPAWTLGALLDFLRDEGTFPWIEVEGSSINMEVCYYEDTEGKTLHPIHSISVTSDNFVDACIKMILKLNEKHSTK